MDTAQRTSNPELPMTSSYITCNSSKYLVLISYWLQCCVH